MSLFFQKSGIVNVKMVITEEKILSNIDKILKLINPNSKKQIVQLDDDSYFKDLVESVKTYLIEYPKKKNFPRNVYKAAYDLVEYATNQFEENTKRIEVLIRKREKNIKLAGVLRDVSEAVKNRAKNWKEIVEKISKKYSTDVIEALNKIGSSSDMEAEEYTTAVKLIDTKINNLEGNLHIEIDMERIEDRSKALSFIGIEIAEALKYIPAAPEEFEYDFENSENITQVQNSIVAPVNNQNSETAIQDIEEESILPNSNEPVNEVLNNISATSINTEESPLDTLYYEETRFEARPTLWQRIKNSKLVRTIKFIMQIKVVLDYPALPEGRDN
ncbi:MAG: hypothetical protein IKM97_05755 [Clostridia bacterium]|nr:hypothetical protein [Clostridia bacterium]